MATEPASAQRTLLVFVGMVLCIGLAWTIRDRVLNGPAQPPDGPLSPYVVQQAEPPLCSGAACTLELAAPLPGQVARRQAVSYQAAAPQVIAAPAGHALVSLPPGLLYTPGSAAGKLSFGIQRWPRVAGDETPPRPVAVHDAGYVRSGRDLRSGEQVIFEGPHISAADAQRVYSELSFQAMPTLFDVSSSSAWQPGAQHGDVMMLHFVAPGQEVTAADKPVEVRRHQVQAATALATMTVYMSHGDGYDLLEQRYASSGSGNSRQPLPEQMWLEWRDKGSTAQGQWRVPASAIQRDGEGARLWLSVEGWAVPVAVSELQQMAGFCVVSETAGARGLPVRVADWRQMGSGARRAAFHAAAAQTMRLLQPNARVIVQPEGLVPGASVARP